MRCLLARRSDLVRRESLLREILNRASQTAWADTARLDLGRILNQSQRYAEAEAVFRDALNLDHRRQAAVEAGTHPAGALPRTGSDSGSFQKPLGTGQDGARAPAHGNGPGRIPPCRTSDFGPGRCWPICRSRPENWTAPAGTWSRLPRLRLRIRPYLPWPGFIFVINAMPPAVRYWNRRKSVNWADAMAADSQILTCLFREGQIQTGVTGFNPFKQLYRKEEGFKACEARFHLEHGKALAAAKRFEPALEALEEAAKSKVEAVVPEAEAELGRTHLIMAHVDEALEILTALPAKYPGNPILDRVYFNLGEHYFNSKQYENSALAYRWVVDNGTDAALRPAALRLLIRAYETIGRPDGAMAAVRTFLRDYPRDPERLAMEVKIGTLYMRLAEYDRAIEVFQRLRPLADTETEAEIQYWIGKSLSAMGRWEEAIFAFLKVNYLSGETKMPWKTTAVFEAGTAYVKLGKTAEARRMFELVIRRDGAAGMFGKVARQRLDELEALTTEGGRKLVTDLFDSARLAALIDAALAEDLGDHGDLSSDGAVGDEVLGEAILVAKEPGVLAGLPVAQAVFLHVDRHLSVDLRLKDGDVVQPGDVVGHVRGRLQPLLTAERTALNFIQRLSGIATVTAQYVEAVKDTDAVVLDTRKTTPTFRTLEKYAVRMGGGTNHRIGLFDMAHDQGQPHRRGRRHRPRRGGGSLHAGPRGDCQCPSRWRLATWRRSPKPWSRTWTASCWTTCRWR